MINTCQRGERCADIGPVLFAGTGGDGDSESQREVEACCPYPSVDPSITNGFREAETTVRLLVGLQGFLLQK